MKGQNNRSSLFEGRPHLHHFATEQDVAEEFYELLSEAKQLYLQEVKTTANDIAATWMTL